MSPRLRVAAAGVAILVGFEAAFVAARLIWPLEAIARGWLAAFAICGAAPIGATVLLLIHALTGGVWGEAAAPTLRPLAALTPVVALAFLPVAVAAPAIYPWATSAAAVPADVARLYFNVPFFCARAVVALGGFAILGVLAATRPMSRLVAGLGLAFYGFAISFVAVDWLLSLEPRMTASAFAAMIAIQQMLAALAVTAMAGPARVSARALRDVGGLMMATLLGVIYLELMIYVISWYGDQSDQAVWYLHRSGGWAGALGAAFALGAVAPFALLLLRAVRRSVAGLRLAGALVALGTVLHVLWLVAPASERGAQASVVVAACLLTLALALMLTLIGSALSGDRSALHAE